MSVLGVRTKVTAPLCRDLVTLLDATLLTEKPVLI